MIRNFIYGAALIILFTGCNLEPQEEGIVKTNKSDIQLNIDSVSLVESGEKYISIDSETSYNTLYLTTYQNNSQRFIVYQSENKNSIQFYNFDSELLDFEIVLSKSGPNAIPQLNGFYVITLDSILVLSGHSRKLFIVNNKAQIERTISLSDGEESQSTSMAIITTCNDPVLVDSILLLNAFPDRSPYYKGYHLQVINLISGTSYYTGRFPDLYSKLNGWDTMSTLVYKAYNPSKNILVSSHMGSKYLYTGTPNNTLSSTYYAGSKFFDEIIPIRNTAEAEDWTYNYLTQNFYGPVIYDKYRDVYYRLAFLSIEQFNAANERNTLEDKPISIIILNNKLQKIGETLLPLHKYFFRTMFVVKEGLYMATTNYKNPKLKEDRLAFELLTLRVNK